MREVKKTRENGSQGGQTTGKTFGKNGGVYIIQQFNSRLKKDDKGEFKKKGEIQKFWMLLSIAWW